MWITGTQWFADFMDTAMEEECTLHVENKIDEEVVLCLFADVKDIGWKLRKYHIPPRQKTELFVSSDGHFYYHATSKSYLWDDDDKYIHLNTGDSLGMRIRSIPIDSLVSKSFTLQLIE
jgi:hypothetical protein